MNIPIIDQKLATIKAMHIQYVNGYYLSDDDKQDMQRATDFVTELNNAIQETK